jgi:hypothetical protein
MKTSANLSRRFLKRVEQADGKMEANRFWRAFS